MTIALWMLVVLGVAICVFLTILIQGLAAIATELHALNAKVAYTVVRLEMIVRQLAGQPQHVVSDKEYTHAN